MATKGYKLLHNEELIDLIFSEEDRLPRAAADEIVRRGSEILPMLAEIASDRTLWTAELPEWWSTVHAAYLIGAIGGPEALTPLLAALRWSDAYESEWVTEDLPSILGSMGDISYPSLIAIAKDRSAGWSARSIAMDSLGSQILRFPEKEEETIAFLGSILKDASEDYGARRAAAFVLLDFRRSDFKREIVEFAKLEARMQEQHADYHPAFVPDEVQRDLSTPRSGLDMYIHDWMEFYNPAEVRRRQERWAEEDGRSRPDAFLKASHAGRGGTFAINHNAPCPCGSGRPYKRCCWKKLH